MTIKLWMVLLAWFIWIGIFITMWALFKNNQKKLEEGHKKEMEDLAEEFNERVRLFNEFQQLKKKMFN